MKRVFDVIGNIFGAVFLLIALLVGAAFVRDWPADNVHAQHAVQAAPAQHANDGERFRMFYRCMEKAPDAFLRQREWDYSMNLCMGQAGYRRHWFEDCEDRAQDRTMPMGAWIGCFEKVN
jgi:hypothetical protein